MRTQSPNRLVLLAAALLVAGLGMPGRQAAAAKVKQWRVPIVMERATLRGKVVVLETRVQERRTINGLPVQVWTPKKGAGRKVKRDRLLHEAKTDMDGFFSLPVLDVGQYLLVVGQLQLRLSVVPESEVRAGQEQEPKVLLILLPKQVI